uniref:Uncharacterized protein n=1 Tax=Pristionchus pacificus TaxID=54126 RepID=A0A2A6BM05_PRIPA|eukprot:PDM66954.1 hypothetical protein PRIPAC_48371 [Pristionchus pacificus]
MAILCRISLRAVKKSDGDDDQRRERRHGEISDERYEEYAGDFVTHFLTEEKEMTQVAKSEGVGIKKNQASYVIIIAEDIRKRQ